MYVYICIYIYTQSRHSRKIERWNDDNNNNNNNTNNDNNDSNKYTVSQARTMMTITGNIQQTMNNNKTNKDTIKPNNDNENSNI